MAKDRRNKLLGALYRLGVQDRDGIRPDDPALDHIAVDLGIELIDDDDEQQRMNEEEANNYGV